MNYDRKITADAEGGLATGYDLSGRQKAGINPKLLIIGGLVLLAILAAAFFFMQWQGAGAIAAADNRSQAPSVTVVTPGQTEIQGTIIATGSIAARREMPVGVVGEGGRVVSVPVEQGQWVNAGQVLASIDRSVQSQQARGAAASVEVARADARLAQSNLDRALQLVERGFVSKADIDRLTATRDSAAARVGLAEAQYRESLARNARLNIVAPAAGLLLERNVEPGATVGAGSGPLFRIAKGGEMELMARVSEDQLATMQLGAVATVTPTGAETSYSGQIWQIEPTIDAQSRQGVARIALAYQPALRPGGFATASINSGRVVAPLLPESAVLSDDTGSYVYIVGEDRKIERRDVTAGIITDQGITIAEGLSGREQVVLRAGGFLNPGETVNPVPAESAE